MERYKPIRTLPDNYPEAGDANENVPRSQAVAPGDNTRGRGGSECLRLTEEETGSSFEEQLYEETAAVEGLIASLELRLHRGTIEAMLPTQRRRMELLFRRWRAMTIVVMEETKRQH